MIMISDKYSGSYNFWNSKEKKKKKKKSEILITLQKRTVSACLPYEYLVDFFYPIEGELAVWLT